MQISTTDYKAMSTKNKQRIHQGKFSNPLDGVPSVVFDEQFVTHDTISGRVFLNDCGSISASLNDPQKPVVLRNPIDDSVIPIEAFIAKLQAQGSFLYEDQMIALYSLGRSVQIERDAALAGG